MFLEIFLMVHARQIHALELVYQENIYADRQKYQFQNVVSLS